MVSTVSRLPEHDVGVLPPAQMGRRGGDRRRDRGGGRRGGRIDAPQDPGTTGRRGGRTSGNDDSSGRGRDDTSDGTSDGTSGGDDTGNGSVSTGNGNDDDDEDSGPDATNTAGRIVIDAIAESDAQKLRDDLVSLGMTDAAVASPMVSGRLPVEMLDQAKNLASARSVRPSSGGTVTNPGAINGDYHDDGELNSSYAGPHETHKQQKRLASQSPLVVRVPSPSQQPTETRETDGMGISTETMMVLGGAGLLTTMMVAVAS